MLRRKLDSNNVKLHIKTIPEGKLIETQSLKADPDCIGK